MGTLVQPFFHKDAMLISFLYFLIIMELLVLMGILIQQEQEARGRERNDDIQIVIECNAVPSEASKPSHAEGSQDRTALDVVRRIKKKIKTIKDQKGLRKEAYNLGFQTGEAIKLLEDKAQQLDMDEALDQQSGLEDIPKDPSCQEDVEESVPYDLLDRLHEAEDMSILSSSIPKTEVEILD